MMGVLIELFAPLILCVGVATVIFFFLGTATTQEREAANQFCKEQGFEKGDLRGCYYKQKYCQIETAYDGIIGFSGRNFYIENNCKEEMVFNENY